MHPQILRALKGELVEMEYQPPQRTSPEILTGNHAAIVWDLFCEDRVTLVVVRHWKTFAPAPSGVNPGTVATQSNQAAKPEKMTYNYDFRWFLTEHILSIKHSAPFHVDQKKNKTVTDERFPLYPDRQQKQYWGAWNKGVWEKIENHLVELGLRKTPLPLDPRFVIDDSKTVAEPVPEAPGMAIPQPVVAVQPVTPPASNPVVQLAAKDPGPQGTAPTPPNVASPVVAEAPAITTAEPAKRPAANVNPLQ